MQIYLAYDKRSGRVVHVHHVADVAGRSCPCAEEEVHRALPGHLEPRSVGILAAEIERIPSSRELQFAVDPERGTLQRVPVKRDAARDRG